MPKRKGYLYDTIKTAKNVNEAAEAVLRGKHLTSEEFLEKFKMSVAETCDMIILDLENYNFAALCHEPNRFEIEEGVSRKRRIIDAPKVTPDQIVHWSLIRVIEKIFMDSMYQYCCGSVPERGPGAVKKYMEYKLRSPEGYKKYKYCLKMDIHHFFQSIDHNRLIAKLQRKIKDPHVISLCQYIIRQIKHGLPIGYYTSQWFANFYLEELDRFIKEELKADVYVRYIDDLVICASKKRKLHRMRKKIDEFLRDRERLQLKDNWQVFPVAVRGIDFCGFRFYHNRTGIRKDILRNIKRANRRCMKPTSRHNLASMISYHGYLDHTDTYYFAKRNLAGGKKFHIKRFKALNEHGVDHEIEIIKQREKQRVIDMKNEILDDLTEVQIVIEDQILSSDKVV